MTEHQHITFYSNTQSRSSAINAVLGVEGLISDQSRGRLDGGGGGGGGGGGRFLTATDKNIAIIEYLKRLPSAARATFVDIKKVLGIDLELEDYVFDMMKSNPKLDFEWSSDSVCSFQYRDKYRITNIWELKQTIERVKTGVVLEDIRTNYAGIEDDCKTLITGGDVIACKNKAEKTIVLYPRGDPFYTHLSGTVQAVPGSNLVKTTADVTGEIRRGDAVRIPFVSSTAAAAAGSKAARFGTSSIHGSWFRVATAEKDADRQPQVALSVTSDPESTLRASAIGVSQKKVKTFHDAFSADTLPLDGDFDGEEGLGASEGRALRHGCSNDVRHCWQETADHVKRLAGDEKALETELKRLALISRASTAVVRTRSAKAAKTKDKKKRANTRTFVAANTHLAGTELGRIIESMNE